MKIMKKINLKKIELISGGAIPTHTKCFIAGILLISSPFYTLPSASYLYNNCG